MGRKMTFSTNEKGEFLARCEEVPALIGWSKKGEKQARADLNKQIRRAKKTWMKSGVEQPNPDPADAKF